MCTRQFPDAPRRRALRIAVLLAEEWCGNRPRPGRRERLWWWPSPAPSRPPRWPRSRSTSRVRCSMLVRTRLARRRCSRRSSRRKGLTNFRGLPQLSHCCSSHCQFRLPSCPHRALTTTDIAAAACTAADPVTPLPPLQYMYYITADKAITPTWTDLPGPWGGYEYCGGCKATANVARASRYYNWKDSRCGPSSSQRDPRRV